MLAANAYTKPKGLDMHEVHCEMQTSGMVKDACSNIVERLAQLKNLLHLSLAKERVALCVVQAVPVAHAFKHVSLHPVCCAGSPSCTGKRS